MTRRDGKFPNIPKIDVDPEVWPEKYWDQSQMCTECETCWPVSHLFKPSVCCDAATTIEDVQPDMRWPQAVSKLLTRRFERAYETYNEGASDEELVLDDAEISKAIDQLIEDTNRDTTSSTSPALANRWSDLRRY